MGGPGGRGTLRSCFELPHALRAGGHGRELVAIALFLRLRPRGLKTPLVLAGASLGLLGATQGAPVQRRGAGRANPGELKARLVSPGFALVSNC